MNYNILIIAPIIGIIAILFGLYKASYVGKQEAGDERMKEISGYIHEGAMAFLQREYKDLLSLSPCSLSFYSLPLTGKLPSALSSARFFPFSPATSA